MTIIKGKIPTTKLPQNWGLVLEGGGTRGSYTAGVLDGFLNEQLMFSKIIGVSAGAANALSYISGQQGRNKEMFEKHISSKKYMGMRYFLKEKSYINQDYVFREVPEEHLYFDWDTFHQNETEFLTGSFHCGIGTTIWHKKEDIDLRLTPIMASASIPFISPCVLFEGNQLLDGGISSPIPIEKSISCDNNFHVIVLTRNKGYKKNKSNLIIPKIMCNGYDKVIEALEKRHTHYNKQIEICEYLEKQGRALIIRPQEQIKISRLECNQRKMMELYEQGFNDGIVAAKKLSWRLDWELKCENNKRLKTKQSG